MTSPSRKDLVRQYKESPRTMGVGQVRNTVSGKVLVVSSRDLPALLNRHQAQLRFGSHQNRELQADFSAVGQEGFAFEIFDTLSPSEDPAYDPSEDLKTLEALWLDKLAPFETAGYNRRPK